MGAGGGVVIIMIAIVRFVRLCLIARVVERVG